MIRCLAIDDEPLALELLEDNIRQVPFLHLIGKCGSAQEALKFLERESPDLIFLDIQMPGLTGLQFIQGLHQKPMIILVTAYEKFALQGFDLDVVDYLVKPVSLERFVKASNKALELFNLKKKQSATPRTAPEYFFVNVDYSMLKLEFNDIQYIEGLKDYVKIHLKSTPKPVITRNSMKALEEQLPLSKFIRIHKSYIVSIASITAVRKSGVLVGATELPVGDNYREAINTLISKTG